MKKILNQEQLSHRIDVARGLEPASLVLRGAKWLDVFSGRWLDGDIAIEEGVIVGVGGKYNGAQVVALHGRTLVPGFIDSHLHLESSLMTPDEFEKVVLPLGTTSVIVDPHEIANVLGTSGLEYILKCAEVSKLDIFVMLSSCVPATHLETSGAHLTAKDLLPYKTHPNVLGLAEMMNYPGVLNKNTEVLEKIIQFQDVPIDGHAPLLRGHELNAYLSCGIRTCHESVSLEEAQEKLERGMLVMLREGSVAKNLQDLVGVLTEFSSPNVSFSTDDRNPVDILDEGHIDHLIKMALKAGVNPHVVYRSASWSVAQRYGLKNKGAIAPGFDADLVVLKDVKRCSVDKVIKNGEFVAEESLGLHPVAPPLQNSIQMTPPTIEQLQVKAPEGVQQPKARIIGVIENSLLTKSFLGDLTTDQSGHILSDPKRDILKIAVVERYGKGLPPSVGFVTGMGLNVGALGSSVGHDSHNVVVVGTNDSDMQFCFERIKEMGGGFVVVKDREVTAELSLPVAGLMTPAPIQDIYSKLKILRKKSKDLGCTLNDPFLQMAFLCLPVIPDLKITDRGLVDVKKFEFVPVIADPGS